MGDRWRIFDYIDRHGNVMQDWADSLPMQKDDRARLDSKIMLLTRYGPDLPPDLLAPIKKTRLLKIRVNGQVALRPLLCRGPFDMQGEFTFLLGAVERDKKLPLGALDKAESNRQILIGSKDKRTEHVRFGK